MEGGFVKRVGTRRLVWNGKAKQTPGGLKKEDLLQNKHGRIVSKKRHETMRAKRI
jgi:hypothetical protein